jgi:phosphomannomutase
MLAMLILLRLITEDGRPLSVIRTEVERYASSGEINFEVDDPVAAVGIIGSAFPDAEHDRLDGLSIDVGEAWFNVRPSNTEPLLRLNVEAESEMAVKDVVNQIESILEESG